MGHLQIDYRHSQTHVVQSLTKNVSNIFFITIWLRYKMCACQVTRGATSQESIILIIKVPIILTETESLLSWVRADGRVVSYLLSGGETSETSETSCWQHLTLWEPLRGGRWLDISVCGLQSQCIHSAVHVSQWGKVSRFIKRIDKLEPEQLLNITNFNSIPLVQFVVWFKNSSSKYQFAPLGGPLCCAVWRYFAGKVYWWPESWRNHIKNIIGLPASSAARTFYLTASLKPQDYGENAGVLYTLTLN